MQQDGFPSTQVFPSGYNIIYFDNVSLILPNLLFQQKLEKKNKCCFFKWAGGCGWVCVWVGVGGGAWACHWLSDAACLQFADGHSYGMYTPREGRRKERRGVKVNVLTRNVLWRQCFSPGGVMTENEPVWHSPIGELGHLALCQGT